VHHPPFGTRSTNLVQLSVAAGTDVGRIRAGNEDSLYADADQERGLFIVADGMGGHAAGEIASEMAVQIVARELADVRDVASQQALQVMAEALRLANRSIFERTITEADKQGMGTTASCLLLGQAHWVIGHIGDSRIYLLRNGTLRQVTKDHSYVQEQVDAGFLTPEQARYHPYSNVITRCVGANAAVEPDILHGDLHAGDVFLLASDGLTGMVDDAHLQKLMETRGTPGRQVDAMITDANRRGGLDNITAIVVQVQTVSVSTSSRNTDEHPVPSHG
jgi:PPM family protein phosphatase